MMAVKIVYERYKHLDAMLSDRAWLPDNALSQCLYDCWQAIKEDAMDNPKEEAAL